MKRVLGIAIAAAISVGVGGCEVERIETPSRPETQEEPTLPASFQMFGLSLGMSQSELKALLPSAECDGTRCRGQMRTGEVDADTSMTALFSEDDRLIYVSVFGAGAKDAGRVAWSRYGSATAIPEWLSPLIRSYQFSTPEFWIDADGNALRVPIAFADSGSMQMYSREGAEVLLRERVDGLVAKLGEVIGARDSTPTLMGISAGDSLRSIRGGCERLRDVRELRCFGVEQRLRGWTHESGNPRARVAVLAEDGVATTIMVSGDAAQESRNLAEAGWRAALLARAEALGLAAEPVGPDGTARIRFSNGDTLEMTVDFPYGAQLTLKKGVVSDEVPEI
jgi:hypothetical protein